MTVPIEPSSRWIRSTFPHQHLENTVLDSLRVEEVVAENLFRRLKSAVDAPVALLDATRVPGDIVVKQIGAMALEVDAFAGRIGAEEYSNRVSVRRSVELALNPLRAARPTCRHETR